MSREYAYRVTPQLPFCRSTYQHIDALFTQVVDWELIERHWHDMMQVVLSIQAGKVLPSMLLQKLGVYSRQSTLYRAFSELGRVERTRFLLQYMSDSAMRQHIRAETTKVESYHQFTDWIAFGGASAAQRRPGGAREADQVSGPGSQRGDASQRGRYDQCALRASAARGRRHA